MDPSASPLSAALLGGPGSPRAVADAYDELRALSRPDSLLGHLSALALEGGRAVGADEKLPAFRDHSLRSVSLSSLRSLPRSLAAAPAAGAGGVQGVPLPPDLDEPRLGFYGAALSLVKVSVGAGTMALPWATVQGGALAAPALVALALWNAYTAWQLLECAPSGSFSDLARRTLGTLGVALLEGALLVVLLGVCVSFQLQAAMLIASITPIPHALCAIISGLLLWPLLLQRSFHGIAILSAIALLVLFLGLVAVAFYGVSDYGMPALPSTLRRMPSETSFADFIGVAAFSFGYQVIVLPVRDSMARPERAPAALAIASIVVTCTYLAIGVGGAALFWRAGVKQLILLNLDASTLIAQVVYVCSATVAVLSVPLVFLPLVAIVKPIFISERAPTFAEDVLRSVLLLGTTTIASVIREFGLLAGLIGCLTGFYAQLLPPLIHLRMVAMRERSPCRRMAKVGLDVILVSAGLVACVWPALTIVTQLAGDHHASSGT